MAEPTGIPAPKNEMKVTAKTQPLLICIFKLFHSQLQEAEAIQLKMKTFIYIPFRILSRPA